MNKLNPTKLERWIKRFRYWCYEITDTKVVVSAFLFVAATYFFLDWMTK